MPFSPKRRDLMAPVTDLGWKPAMEGSGEAKAANHQRQCFFCFHPLHIFAKFGSLKKKQKSQDWQKKIQPIQILSQVRLILLAQLMGSPTNPLTFKPLFISKTRWVSLTLDLRKLPAETTVVGSSCGLGPRWLGARHFLWNRGGGEEMWHTKRSNAFNLLKVQRSLKCVTLSVTNSPKIIWHFGFFC